MSLLELVKCTSLYMLGYVCVWWQLNIHSVYQWWEGKTFLAIMIFGVPASFFFMTGWNIAVEGTGQLWTARYISFAASWVPFPILTWYYMSESPFSWPTVICFALACIIIVIQFYK